ncbi:MAG: hypothetical protein RDU20_20610 [Desulfomonilaceae bacterium]|nr:hypothetical protein [Desulfomonilaceae bacterium]
MKRVTKIFLAVIVGLALVVPTAYAENFPNAASAPPDGPRLSQEQARQQMYYGYVPPAPIRHTWPGGYRNILHELFNTLSEHMLGQY